MYSSRNVSKIIFFILNILYLLSDEMNSLFYTKDNCRRDCKVLTWEVETNFQCVVLYIVFLLVKSWHRVALNNQLDKACQKTLHLNLSAKILCPKDRSNICKPCKILENLVMFTWIFSVHFSCFVWIYTLQNNDRPSEHIIKDKTYTNKNLIYCFVD
jgi:hypothetical protein